MEDVYHYTRSPAWEELVSKIQHWIIFVLTSFLISERAVQFPLRTQLDLVL